MLYKVTFVRNDNAVSKRYGANADRDRVALIQAEVLKGGLSAVTTNWTWFLPFLDPVTRDYTVDASFISLLDLEDLRTHFESARQNGLIGGVELKQDPQRFFELIDQN